MRNFVAAVLLVVALPATATVFCGGNGNVHLSFTEGPELQSVHHVETTADGVVMVDVYAVLQDVVRVDGPGGAMVSLGGFELDLRITGAEPQAIEKKVLIPHRDFGGRPTQCLVGTHPGEKIMGTSLPLVRWRVVLSGELADVRFDLDPAGLHSCATTAGCPESGASALYVGTPDAGQENYLFGAGCMPAVLNPSGEPTLELVPCTASVAAIGVFQPAD
jgi:hypothetical protein